MHSRIPVGLKEAPLTSNFPRALIKIKQERQRPINIIAGGAQHCTKPALRVVNHDDTASYPCHVTKAEELGKQTADPGTPKRLDALTSV